MSVRIRSGLALFLWFGVPAAGAEPASPQPLLVFEPNQGQAGAETRFVARAAGYTAHLGAGGEAACLPASGETRPPVRIRLAGGRDAPPEAEMRLPSWTRVYQGSAPHLRTRELPHFAQVRYAAVYPGIDLVYRGQAGAMEIAFELSPGADPGRIALRWSGVRKAWLDEHGALLLRSRAGTLRFRPPMAFQPAPDGVRTNLKARYVLAGKEVRFALSGRDPARPLVIDPVLEYSSYLGGSGFDAAHGMALDTSGNLYLTGETASSDFPVQAGGKAGVRRNRDAFVTKISPSGGAILYTTILAGAGNDAGKAIAVDAQGQAYVAGAAGGDGFPTTQGSLRTSWAGGGDGFLARLDAGGALLFSTYLGEGGADTATGVALAADGGVLVSGYTNSVKFPTTAGAAQSVYAGGGSDAFLLKTSADGKTLLASTLLGGSDTELASAVVADSLGGGCLAGYTASRNLPVRNALQASAGGGGDAMLACLNASGTDWTFVTYLGGSSYDQAQALARGSDGSLFVTGATSSSNFPSTSGAYKSASRGGYDMFLTKVASSGSSILYSALAGGTGSDTGTAVAVDSSGRAWVGGYTQSSNFPTQEAWQSGFGGATDGFVLALGSQGASLESSGYLGGSGDDRVLALALGPAASVWAAGQTASTNFPIKGSALQTLARASYNAFLTRLTSSSPATIPTQAVAGDFDGNGKPDLVWQNDATRRVSIWYLGGNGGVDLLSTTDLAGPDMAGWRLAAIADMDRNGKPDLIWQNDSTRQLRYWLMTGSRGDQILSEVPVAGADMKGWRLVAAVDMNLDGHPDLVWNSDVERLAVVWYTSGASGAGISSTIPLTGGPMTGWALVGLADMDRNGKVDIIWQNDETRVLATWFMQGPQGNQFLGFCWLTGGPMVGWGVTAFADLDQDGHEDLVWMNDDTRQLALWYLQGPEGNVFKGFNWLSGAARPGWTGRIGR